MSIALASRVKNEMCYIHICIDDFVNDEICGRIYNAYYSDAVFFSSSMEMFKTMNDIFDIFGYPHSTVDLRSFYDEESAAAVNKARAARMKSAPRTNLVRHEDVRGKLVTLRTRIMFRQNATWQGRVRWIEEDLSENFSSVLELIMLISSIFESDT